MSFARAVSSELPIGSCPARLHAIEIDAVDRLASDGPEPRISGWLTDRERGVYERLRVPKRRRDWLAGRLAAKEAIRRRHALSGERAFARIEILTAENGLERGRPYYLVDGSSEASFGLSIAHSGNVAVATLARRRGDRIGVDVEQPVETGPGFESLLLSPCERRGLENLVGVERRQALTRLWVLKEASTKALGVGLRLPLSAIRVVSGPGEPPAIVLSPETETTLGAPAVEAAAFERDGLWFAWVSLTPRTGSP